MKTTFSLITALCVAALAGCDNATDFDDGSAPPIPVISTAWEGAVRYGKVQFVGVDQYGQPQSNSDGEYIGQVYRTNEDGRLENALINGNYTGPMLVVLTKDSYTVEIDGVQTSRETEIRCPLPNGCVDDAGGAVSFNEWYVPSDGFKLTAMVHEIPTPLVVHITPVSHLASQLAFADFVSDGSNCTDASCAITDVRNGLTTAEKIFEANSRVQKQMQLNSGFAHTLDAWGSEDITDTVVQLDSAKNSLLSMSVFKQMQDRSESYSQTVSWWRDSYMDHQGQFFEDDQTNIPKQLDFKTLFEDAVAIEGQYSAADLSDSNLQSAAAVFSNILGNNELTANEVTAVTGDLLPVGEGEDSLATQVQAAKDLVSNVSSWLTGFETQDYTSFFNQEIHDDITEMETKWGSFTDKLGPVQQSLFLPIIQLAEYGVTCLRGSNQCDTTHALHSGATYNSSTGEVSYAASGIQLQGRFDDENAQSDLTQKFIFTGSNIVETADGVATLTSADSKSPEISITLQSSLAAGATPDIRKIDVELPSIEAKGKELDGSIMGVRYLVEDLTATLRGVIDPVATEGFTDEQIASSVHFNIESLQFTGNLIEGSGGAQEEIVTRADFRSSNALVYYSPNRFPDLRVDIDQTALKTFASFGGMNADTSMFGGWLEKPANVTDGELLSGKVSYGEETYDNLEAELKEILALNNVVSSSYGALEYPGGITALVIWKENANDTEEKARQCLKVSGVWGCFTEVPLKNLGCGNEFGQATATMAQAYSYLESEGCISQVNIDGRGIYDIQYPDGNFTQGEVFDIQLNKAHTLGLSSFNVRSVGFFNQPSTTESGGIEDAPNVLFDVTGAATDLDTITLGVSLTHGYQGFSQTEGLSFFNFIPYGERSLWLAVGTDADQTDALVYYILQDNITLTMTAFDYEDSSLTNSVDNNPDHSKPLGYVRHAGKLLGTLSKEGDSLYVVRYIDGSWQVL